MTVTLTNLQQQQLDHPRQWLLTNGLGGYAMGTEPGFNARRYDGLLVAAARPPLQRIVALHSVVDRLVWPDERTVHLATQRFGPEAKLHPDGCARQLSITVDPPHRVLWRFQIDDTQVTRQLQLHPDRNAATLTWQIRDPQPPCVLMVRPFTPMRSFHELDHASAHSDGSGSEHTHRGFDITSPSRHSMRIARDQCAAQITAPAGSWRHVAQWWYDFAYLFDRARGQHWREDVFSPGEVHWHLWSHGEATCELTIELVEPALPELPARSPAAMDVRPDRAATIVGQRATWQRLSVAADQFLVRRLLPGADRERDTTRWGRSIIAGYPWFSDWGRDAMICIPGLLLSRGRCDDATEVLLTFARQMQHGLIPNCFDDGSGAPLYNSVDAGLWFIHASWLVCTMQQQGMRPADAATRAELRAACNEIIAAYRAGTCFGIRCDPDDGLLVAGDDAHALTWMDAVRDGTRFTPRVGKPIEINALWHHALRCAAELNAPPTEQVRDGGRENANHQANVDAAFAAQCTADAERVRAACAAYWWDDRQCLHDTLIPAPDATSSPSAHRWIGDATLRPNQFFAVALPHALLDRSQQLAVVNAVEQHLLTACGVRTLEPDDASYRCRYEGDLRSRDAAYHQGTAWPWLLGPYCEAMLRAHDFSQSARARAEQVIERTAAEIDRACLGQIAEVYDGDDPQRPDGCPAQAWSVAELLRIHHMLQRATGARCNDTVHHASR